MIDALLFRSNRKLYLAGFGIYKSSKDEDLKCEAGIHEGPTYDSKLFYRNCFVIKQKDNSDPSNDKIHMFMFPDTLEIIPDKTYLIYSRIQKGHSSKGTLCNSAPHFDDKINDIYSSTEFITYTSTNLSENGTTETAG